MTSIALALFIKALLVALALVLPLVGGVAIVGVTVGIAQTIVQVQDQNVAFFPKLVAVSAIAALAGMPALSLLRDLLEAAIVSLPRIAGS